LTRQTFSDAQDSCQNHLKSIPGAKYSDLLTIWDDYEMAFAQTFLRDDQITNRDPDSEEIVGGFWMGLQYRYGKWSWVDNWPLLVSNWAPGHPDSDSWNEKRDCGRLNNIGQFYNDNCKEELPFACKDAVFSNI